MISPRNKLFRRVCFAILVICAMASVSLRADDAQTAKDILATREVPAGGNGLHAGLCVHVGCGREGSPALTAELAAAGRMLVHGICWDSAALDRAQAAIVAKNVVGQASVEKLSGKMLPYVSDLCNLIVVEDMRALAAKGIGRDELMRVLSPRGTLCVMEDGQWTKMIKPRPEGMDDWTHPHHGPDENMVSDDRLVRFPVGLRWIGGLPKSINKWASVRGWVLAHGRCYAVSSSEIENVGVEAKMNFLVCRDAFNGLPLWKIPLGTFEEGGRLYWRNTSPLATDGPRVYAVGRGKALIVDGATGKIEHAIDTKHQPERLLLIDGTLVLSCWGSSDETKAPFERGGLWGPWVNTEDNGSVEAYDCQTGQRLWKLDHPAYSVLAKDGTVFMLRRDANPATENHLIAVDARSGKQLWRVSHTDLGDEPDLQLDLAGPGFLAVSKRKKESLNILDSKTGKLLWSKQYGVPRPEGWKGIPAYRFIALVAGKLWYADEKLDPLTGEVVGKLPTDVPRKGITICVPPIVFGNIFGISREAKYVELPDGADSSTPIRTHMLHAARGSCIQGMTPANGMLYTSQNNCMCEPGQILGFLAFGPNGELPAEDVFGQSRPVERGPAFARARPESLDTIAWPMQLANSHRDRKTDGTAPESLKLLWRASAAEPNAGAMKVAWDSRMAPVLTPPVAADGRVFVAATETGQVKAFDTNTGKPAWTVTLGSRIDSAPTILGNLCIVGVRDGWVYALTTDTGELAWRSRVAPLEQRIVVHGRVESTWPAVGSVLLHDGKLFAHAGRGTEADGGIAVVQLDPTTGETLWAGMIDGASRVVTMNRDRRPLSKEEREKIGKYRHMQRRIDLLRVADGTVVCNQTAIEPGSGVTQARQVKSPTPGGPMLDGYLGRFKMRGFNPADTRATAGEHTVIATVLAQGGGITLHGNGKKDNGQPLAELKLDAAPIHGGLAIAGGKVFVSLEDGRLLCLGGKGGVK